MSRPRIEAVVFDFGETLYDETSAWSAVADADERLVRGRRCCRGPAADLHGDAWRADRRRPVASRDLRSLRRAGAAGLAAARRRATSTRTRVRACSRCGRAVFASGSPPISPIAPPRSGGPSVSSSTSLATSAAWGVEKPSPAFFARIASELALPPAAIAYVGDRVDNDVTPADRGRNVRASSSGAVRGAGSSARREARRARIHGRAISALFRMLLAGR